MGNFILSYNRTSKFEGGYSNQKDDKGGESYKGISRVFHPFWNGWKIIDNYKSKKFFPNNLVGDSELELLVKDFYKIEFWNKIQGDAILNQELADELFDMSVNFGAVKAIIYLQRALNILNKNKLSYNDIIVDGVFGTKTLMALSSCIKANGWDLLLNVLNGFQIKHYIEIMERNPSQEIFIGWFKRVKITWENN